MIVPSLTKLFNKSFGSEKVPKLWKEANITPLHKKGNKDDVNNYKPVSLLSCVGKILDRIVFKKLYNYYLDHIHCHPTSQVLGQVILQLIS